MFSRLLLTALLAITVTAQAADNAGNPGTDASSGRINLTLADAPLKAVLDNLFQAAGKSYKLDAALDKPPYDTMKVSVSLSDVMFKDALDTIVKIKKLSYREEDGVYVISPDKSASAKAVTPAGTAATPSANQVEQRLITLDLNRTPVKTAIQALFAGMGMNYAIDPSLDIPPYDSMVVTLSLRDVPFDQALRHLVKAVNVVYRKDGGVYIFSVRKPAANASGSMPGIAPANSGKPDLVTMVLLPMPVKDAITKLRISPQDGTEMPSWQFANELGNTQMPGVKFYNFPRYPAIQFTIVASGLVPPVGVGGRVETRGDIDMSKLFSWEPMTDSSGIRDAAYYVATGSAHRGPTSETAISIAARRVANKWLLTVVTDQAFDIDVIERLFSFTGASYVIGARSPFATAKSLSAKLYDVTLDQALDVLLPSVGMTYRKAGLPQNPTYVVSESGAHYQPGPSRPPVVPRPSMGK